MGVVVKTLFGSLGARFGVAGRFPGAFGHLEGDGEAEQVTQEVRALARLGVQKTVERALRQQHRAGKVLIGQADDLF